MVGLPRHRPALPIIDIRHNGIGDVVVASWLVHSARRIGLHVLMNPRNQREAAELLSVPPSSLTSTDAEDWSTTPGIGHQHEYALVPTAAATRFDAWCASLGMPGLEPVRPPYAEDATDGAWADAQWATLTADRDARRVLVFPEAAWPLRTWPKAYFIDLVSDLRTAGAAVAAMGANGTVVMSLPCHWWAGFSLRQVAAMARRADLVIANDSGPAHLAAAIGTATLAVCGPTDPRLVFGHDPNVRGIVFPSSLLPCAPCHLSRARGFRHACDAGGCQALMRLDPRTVLAAAREMLTKDVAVEV